MAFIFFKTHKKKVILIILSLIGILISLGFYLSALFGYFLGKIFSGKKEKMPGKIKSLKIEFEKYIFHLHHWILGLTLLIISYYLNPFYLFYPCLAGFFSGIIFQGIYQYRDWYQIIKKKNV